MSEEIERRARRRKWLWTLLIALTILLAVLIVPPLVSISRYKAQVTSLLASSLGRPVHLSSVELRLLPQPGFLLTDLSVADDPAYSAEPILHADSVTAHINLLSLWKGKLEIGSISVEDASLNVVRTPDGHWNLDPFLRTAARAQSAGSGPSRALRLPSLRATSTRINFKDGAEKLPFSLVNANISFSQERPGEWYISLRCQPARTDINFDPADTGVLRAEVTLRTAPSLRQVPIHLDLDWREAQLGVLNRLVFGRDPGWRGNLTAELALDGTGETAKVQTRLRAIGVHRAEFAPAAPLDFDVRCNLQAHGVARVFDNVNCDTPLGGGRIHLTGSFSTAAAPTNLALDLDRIPAAAALDLLRTVRSDFGSGLDASGAISGRMAYAPPPAAEAVAAPAHPSRSARTSRSAPAPPSPLTGSFTVQNLEVRGNGLGDPLRAARIQVEPAPYGPEQPIAVIASAAIPAGAPQPLVFSARFSLDGYQISVHGPAAIARARQVAKAAGLSGASFFDAVAGEPLTAELVAQGPWMPPARIPFGPPATEADSLSGTIAFRNANWRSDYLLNPVEIAQATLHLGSGEMRFDPVAFSYGPVKGTATVTLPLCEASATCTPRFTVQFGAVDAAVLRGAFLGARTPGTMLSTLLERIHPTPAPAWPMLEGTVRADSLILGPVALHEPEASLHILANGADIDSLDAALLGGRIHLTGRYRSGPNAADKPSWSVEGSAEKLDSAQLAPVLGLRASGGKADLSGKLDLTGFGGDDLAASARGSLNFDWQKSGLSGAGVPAALARFDRWTGEGAIGSGTLALKNSQSKRAAKTAAVDGSLTLQIPARLVFPAPPKLAAKR